MSTFTERLELLITSSAKGAVTGIKETDAAVTQLDSKAKGATGVLQKFGIQGEATGAILSAGVAGGAIAAGAAVTKFAVDGVNSFVNLAGEVRNFQRVSGASAEDSSRMVAVLDDMGISADKGASAMFRMSRTVAEGGDGLRQYGVEIAKNRDGTTNMVETLLNVADAYTETEDAGTRAALVQEAFGRGGKDLIPILEQGREGLRDFFAEAEKNHQIFSQEDLQQARDYELAIDSLQDSMQGLQRSAGQALVPTLTTVADSTADTITTADELTSSFGGVAGGMRFLNESFNPLMFGINATGGAMKIFQGDFRDGSEQMVRSAGLIGKGAANLGEAIGIFSKGGEETDKFTAAQQRLADAQQAVVTLSADGTTKASELAAAKRELTQAEDGYEAVVGRVTTALQGQTSKLVENTLAAQQYMNTQLGVQGAQLNVEAATQKYNETLFVNGAEALETRQAAHNLEVQYAALGEATKKAALEGGASQKEAAEQQVAALSWVAGTLEPGSPLRVFLDDYINTLRNGIPKQVDTVLQLTTSIAQGFVAGGGSGHGEYIVEGAGATGAIVNRPTVALIGEAGPEVLAPLSSLPGNAPLPGSMGAGGAQTLVLSGGPPGLAEWFVDQINQMARGGPVFLASAVG